MRPTGDVHPPIIASTEASATPPVRAERWQMHDLVSQQRFVWQGDWHFVQLDPHRAPAHVFVIRRHVRREQDFDYFE